MGSWLIIRLKGIFGASSQARQPTNPDVLQEAGLNAHWTHLNDDQKAQLLENAGQAGFEGRFSEPLTVTHSFAEKWADRLNCDPAKYQSNEMLRIKKDFARAFEILPKITGLGPDQILKKFCDSEPALKNVLLAVLHNDVEGLGEIFQSLGLEDGITLNSLGDALDFREKATDLGGKQEYVLEATYRKLFGTLCNSVSGDIRLERLKTLSPEDLCDTLGLCASASWGADLSIFDSIELNRRVHAAVEMPDSVKQRQQEIIENIADDMCDWNKNEQLARASIRAALAFHTVNDDEKLAVADAVSHRIFRAYGYEPEFHSAWMDDESAMGGNADRILDSKKMAFAMNYGRSVRNLTALLDVASHETEHCVQHIMFTRASPKIHARLDEDGQRHYDLFEKRDEEYFYWKTASYNSAGAISYQEKNFYIPSDGHPSAYLLQPIEVDSYDFGIKFSEKMNTSIAKAIATRPEAARAEVSSGLEQGALLLEQFSTDYEGGIHSAGCQENFEEIKRSLARLNIVKVHSVEEISDTVTSFQEQACQILRNMRVNETKIPDDSVRKFFVSLNDSTAILKQAAEGDAVPVHQMAAHYPIEDMNLSL